MSRVLHYGIIGFGGIGENRIAKEGFSLDRARFAELPDHRLLYATDMNPQRRSAAEALGISWCDSAEELLAKEDIEAVFIASINSAHAQLAAQAMRAGKHVLLEKPMTTNPAEAEALVSLAEELGLSFAVDLMMKRNPYNRKARELIGNREIGEIEYIVLHMEFPFGTTPEEAATWRCSVPSEYGGPIGDVASHCLYMAEFLLQDTITSLQARYTPVTLDIAVENGANITFTTKKGMQGAVRVAFNQPRGSDLQVIRSMGFEVYGTGGVLRSEGTLFQLSGTADEPVPIRLFLEKAGERTEIFLPHSENIYRSLVAEHAQSIRERKPLTGADGLHNLALVFSCYESADQEGKRISITR